MNDTIVLACLVLLFAAAATFHLAIAYGLAFRRPRWRAPLALLAPPLAPYWALRSGMRIRGAAWLVAVVAYLFVRWRWRAC